MVPRGVRVVSMKSKTFKIMEFSRFESLSLVFGVTELESP